MNVAVTTIPPFPDALESGLRRKLCSVFQPGEVIMMHCHQIAMPLC